MHPLSLWPCGTQLETIHACSGRPLDGSRRSSCAATGTRTLSGNMRTSLENSVIRRENALRMRPQLGVHVTNRDWGGTLRSVQT